MPVKGPKKSEIFFLFNLHASLSTVKLYLSVLPHSVLMVLGPHGHSFCSAVRATIFGALYIIVGKRVWIFPNILAEEATLGELFRFWPKKDEEERPKWTTRLFYAIVAVLFILLLRHHAPDEAARAR